VEVVASLSQGRTAAAQCGLFTHKSVPVIFEPPCRYINVWEATLFKIQYIYISLYMHLLVLFLTTNRQYYVAVPHSTRIRVFLCREHGGIRTGKTNQ